MLKWKSDCFRDLCPYIANKNGFTYYPSSLLQGLQVNSAAGNPLGLSPHQFTFLPVSLIGVWELIPEAERNCKGLTWMSLPRFTPRARHRGCSRRVLRSELGNEQTR